jgi:hypothetical protein
MSIRRRTTKLLARRHDLNYFKRLSPIRAWQWWLALIALGAALIWIGESQFLRGSTAFSAGPMSTSHAVFGQKCEVCHVPAIRATRFTPAFAMRRSVPDSACLQCHTVGPHHGGQVTNTPTCGSCHREHIGATHLAAVTDNNCTQCHADLHTQSGMLQIAAHVRSFASDHPEFRPLRTASPAERAQDFALRFDHAAHMHPNIHTPHNVIQTLTCSSCHIPAVDATGARTGSVAPVNFDRSCRTCHSLEFDAHISAQAPHDDPAKVRAFVTQSIQQFADAHPNVVAYEIQHWPPEPPLPERIQQPPPHSQAEWITNRTVRAEIILWREKCALCHRRMEDMDEAAQPEGQSVAQANLQAAIALPHLEPVSQPANWMSDAVFSHTAHQAVACAECHSKALTSALGTDDLMPNIATCRRCHDGRSSPQGPALAAGHAESGCFLCHVYHSPMAPAQMHNTGYTIKELLGK